MPCIALDPRSTQRDWFASARPSITWQCEPMEEPEFLSQTGKHIETGGLTYTGTEFAHFALDNGDLRELTGAIELALSKEESLYRFLDQVLQEHTYSLAIRQSDIDQENLQILAEIERSRAIIDLTDNWDQEGSPGYREETWKRATSFLGLQVQTARQYSWTIGVPDINPADNGSIDIFWKNEDRELLLNVPADEHEPIAFYGDSRNGETISGQIRGSAPALNLVAWLS